jgi:hypothetical protein
MKSILVLLDRVFYSAFFFSPNRGNIQELLELL